MTDVILIVLLVAVVLLALRSSVKHFKGQGGCCGGDTYKARRKKLGSVAEKRTLLVGEMHCQNCVNRVMEAVNALEGASAVVRLKQGEVVVSLERPLDNAVIKAAIEKAGYPVKGVK